MQTIGPDELERLLLATSRCQFVSLSTVTDPDMRKTGNRFFGVVRKVTIARGVICFTYSRVVNSQRKREGRIADFKAFRRRWGHRIRGTPLVSHVPEGDQQQLYLELKIETRSAHYFSRKTGKRIDAAKLAPFLKKPQHATRQGIDKEVILRDYTLSNIAELTLGGVRYVMDPSVTELRRYFPPATPKRKKAIA